MGIRDRARRRIEQGGKPLSPILAAALEDRSGLATDPFKDRKAGIGDEQACRSTSPDIVIAFSAGQSARSRSLGESQDAAPTLRAGPSGSNQVPTFCYAVLDEYAGNVSGNSARSSHVNAVAASDYQETGDLPDSEYLHGWVIRKATPIECERLMGLPDGWTDVPVGNRTASKAARYKACGNAMAVPCIRWIGNRLADAVLS